MPHELLARLDVRQRMIRGRVRVHGGARMNYNLTVKVLGIVAEQLGIDPARLTDEARLRDDLGADWLDRLELMIAIEDQVAGVEIADVVVDQIDTIGDLMRVVESVENGRARAWQGGNISGANGGSLLPACGEKGG
jgi:acyl carrier protein